jgi:hypothetical protein
LAAFGNCWSLKSISIPASVRSIGPLAFSRCDSLTSVTLHEGLLTIGERAFANNGMLTTINIPKSVLAIGKDAFDYTGLPADHIAGYVDRLMAATSVTIPEGVTVIAERAFEGYENLTSVTLPEGVITIGEKAFAGCKNLTSIIIPNSVTHIGDAAFRNCAKLTDVTLPDSLTYLGEYAFAGCKSLTSITIPDGMTEIARNAFNGCSELVSVNIPNSVTTIRYDAFANCGKLTSITIPNSVTWVGGGAFRGSGLTSVTIPGSVTSYGSELFSNSINLTDVTIQEGFKIIGERTFAGCVNLTSITLPEGLVRIEREAFAGCKNLTSITLPQSVNYIGRNAFHATGLASVPIPENVIAIEAGMFPKDITSVTIPSSVTTIGDRAFLDYENLTSVTIPNSVTTIGEQAFMNCKNLTSVTIPNSVVKIDRRAFSGSGLTSITIPGSVRHIEEEAFSNCENLTSVTISDGVRSIGRHVFRGSRKLATVTIPNSVTRLLLSMFMDMGMESALIPKGVTRIIFGEAAQLTSIEVDTGNAIYGSEDGVLFDKSKIELLRYPPGKPDSAYTVPSSVRVITWRAFINSRLKAVTLPANIMRIDHAAFDNCDSLMYITVLNPRPPSFSGITTRSAPDNITNITLVVPQSGIEAYRNASDWSMFKSIQTFEDDGAAEQSKEEETVLTWNVGPEDNLGSVTASLTGTRLVISGNGSIRSRAFSHFYDITEVEIREGIIAFASNVFENCENLHAINVADGNVRFRSVNGILFSKDETVLVSYPAGRRDTVYTVSAGVRTIGHSAIWNPALRHVTIPASVTRLENFAIATDSLTSLTVLNPIPPSLDHHVFSRGTNVILFVPSGSVEAYQANRRWNVFKNILPLEE